MPVRRCLILSLLIGAVTTLAVTWGCVLLPDPPLRTEYWTSHADGRRWIFTVWTRFGVTLVDGVPDNGSWGRQDAETNPDVIPHWSRTRERPEQAEFDDLKQPWTRELGYGWPARSGVSVLRVNVKAENVWHAISGIETADDGSGTPIPFKVIPVRPIWSGFAINAATFAAVAFVVLFARGVARRAVRRRRGQCVACGYPVESSACPECGAVASATEPAAATG